MSMFGVDYLMSELYRNELKIDLKELFTIFKSKHDYDVFCEYITNYIMDDYTRANNVVTIYDENNNIINISLFQLLINLYLLEFNFMYKVPVTRDWLLDIDKRFFQDYHKHIEEYTQTKIYPFIKRKRLNSGEVFSWFLSNLTERLTRLTELFAPISAPTLNLFDIAKFTERDANFRDLLDTTIDETKSFATIEKELVEDGKRLKKIILQDGKSCLVPFIESGCLNDQQLQQMFIAVGPRMSSSNIVMNHIMKRSYLNGLQNVGDLIAESEIAAKGLIWKKKYVSVSGYMSRETNLTGMNLSIDYSMEDCGTPHYVNYQVKDKKFLDLVISKNMILPNRKIVEIKPTDTHLIGQTIKLRSIVTCAHPNRHKVCKCCYGNPKEFKSDYMIGGATSTQIENPLSNLVMAVKHHTGTKTKEFDNEELLKLFNNEDSKLVLKQLKEADKISILFNKEYVEDIVERIENDVDIDDDDDVDTENINSNSVVSSMLTDITIITKKYDEFTNEETETSYDVTLDGVFLTLSPEMMTLQNVKKIELPIDSEVAILHLEDIKPGTAVFNIKYITAETSRYIKELKNIIERSKPTWYTNLDEPINEFADLINRVGMKNKELVYMEPIIHALTRDPNNIMKRPNFSKKNVDLCVVNLKTAIFKGDLYSSLIFQELTKVFKDIDSFYKDPSIGDGIHDSAFKTSIKQDFRYMKKALKKSGLI